MPDIGQRTVLAFDFGTKSIGVAVGQEVTGTASPLAALKARDGIPDWQQIAALYEEWQPHLVVVGLPLNMDGSEQEMTQRAKKFANRLHGRFKVAVETCDEPNIIRNLPSAWSVEYWLPVGFLALSPSSFLE